MLKMLNSGVGASQPTSPGHVYTHHVGYTFRLHVAFRTALLGAFGSEKHVDHVHSVHQKAKCVAKPRQVLLYCPQVNASKSHYPGYFKHPVWVIHNYFD